MPPAELATYFAAEKEGGWLLVAMSVASLAGAAWFWSGQGAYRAILWPLLILGAAELAVGLTIALRTPSQVAVLERGLQSSRAQTLSAEIQRMDRVNRSFRMVKIAEVVVLVISLGLILFLQRPGTGPAVGFGLLIEAGLLLVFDVFAHQRALIYSDWLKQLS